MQLTNKHLAILASFLTSSAVLANPLGVKHHHREVAAKLAEREIPVIDTADAVVVAREAAPSDMALEIRGWSESGLVPVETTDLWERDSAEEGAPVEEGALAVRSDLVKRGGTKNGLGWLNGPKITLFVAGPRPVSWCYTWSEWWCEPKGKGIEHVPMLWGTSKDKINKFKKFVKKYPPKWVLGFNEPDLKSQAYISPDKAVNVWMDAIHPLKARKVSPAPSGGPSGQAWLREFLKKCRQRGCKIDNIGAHFYATNSKDLINYVKGMHDEFGMDVWVTEFACRNFGRGTYCTPDQAAKFNAEVIAWFESTPYIYRYSAFGSLQSMYNVGDGPRLMNAQGTKLTSLGKKYIGQ